MRAVLTRRRRSSLSPGPSYLAIAEAAAVTTTVPEGRPGGEGYSPPWRVEYSPIPSLMRLGGEVDSAKFRREVCSDNGLLRRPSPPPAVLSLVRPPRLRLTFPILLHEF